MVPETGIEPATVALRKRRSTVRATLAYIISGRGLGVLPLQYTRSAVRLPSLTPLASGSLNFPSRINSTNNGGDDELRSRYLRTDNPTLYRLSYASILASRAGFAPCIARTMIAGTNSTTRMGLVPATSPRTLGQLSLSISAGAYTLFPNSPAFSSFLAAWFLVSNPFALAGPLG